MENPSTYVDVYVNPIAKSKIAAFQKFGAAMAQMATKHGALYYFQGIADDVKPGNETSFPQAVKLGDDEVVFISWAVFKSREDRDRVNKSMMADPAFHDMFKEAPIDGKRMFMGGFKTS